MRYVTGVDENGKPIDVRDPLVSRLRAIADAANGDRAALVNGLLDVREIFGSDLSEHSEFRRIITQHLSNLFNVGAKVTAENLTEFNRV